MDTYYLNIIEIKMVELESKWRRPEEEDHSFSSGGTSWQNKFALLDLAKQALGREKWSIAFLDEPIG